MAPQSSPMVGKVFIIHGTVKAVSPSGVERTLTVNSPVYAHERIVTGADGSVSITMMDGGNHLQLGRMSDVTMDEDVFGGAGQGHSETVAQAADIQAALEDENFDPTTDLPATAAGGGTGGTGGAGGARGGGRQIVVFDADQMEVLPDSGAETRGIGYNFLDPPPGGEFGEESQVPNGDVPTIVLAPASVEVQEDALGNPPYGDADDGVQGNLAGVSQPTDSQTIDLTTLTTVNLGADTPGSVQYALLNPGGAAADGLTSHGEQVYYFLNQTTGALEGRAGSSPQSADRLVFTVDLDTSGKIVFDLQDALDHFGDHQSQLALTDLGQYIQVTATDANGDHAVADFGGLLVINVLDDMPSLTTSTDRLAVDEDGLTGHAADGTPLNAGETTGTGSATASGSLADNFNFGADGVGSTAILSVNGVTANASGHIVVSGTGYTLDVLASTGAYTLSLTDNMSHSGSGEDLQGLLADGIALDVVAVDGDGDPAHGTVTLQVNVLDDMPSLTTRADNLTVDEDGLLGHAVDGTPLNAGETTGTGSATASGSLADNFNFGADGVGSTAILSVNGVTANASGHIVVSGTGYTLDVLASTGAYTFMLTDNMSHSGSGEDLQGLLADGIALDVVAVDGDGDQALGTVTLQVDVLDDMPTLTTKADNLTVDEDGLPGHAADGTPLNAGETTGTGSATASGNLADNFNFGADGVGSTAILCVNGVTANASGHILVSGTGYTLDVLASTGAYTFTLTDNVSHSGSGEDLQTLFADGIALDVVAVDGDGDQAHGKVTLQVNVLDDMPRLTTSTDSLTVDEDGLAGHAADGTPLNAGETTGTGSATASGSLADNFNFGADGAGSTAILSVNGVTANASGHILVSGTGYTLDVLASTGAYTFTLTDNVSHSGSGEDLQGLLADGIALDVIAVDGDGDQAHGTVTLQVNVLDDMPTLTTSTDSLTVDEDGLPGHAADGTPLNAGETTGTGSATASGSLADNFNFGADGVGSTAIQSVNGVTANASGHIVVSGTGYMLDVLASTGAYTFTLTDNVSHSGSGEDLQALLADGIELDVVAVDGDGDQTHGTVTLQVDVLDDMPTMGDPQDAILANEAGTTAVGDLDLNFGADGAHATNALLLLDTTGQSLIGHAVTDVYGTALTAGGDALVYVSDGAGGVVAVTDVNDAAHTTAFSVSLDPALGTYTVTMGTTAIDPVNPIETTLTSGSGVQHATAQDFPSTGDLVVHATASWYASPSATTPTATEVYWDTHGLYVNSSGDSDDDGIDPREMLTLAFADENGQSNPLKSVTVTLDGLIGTETAHYELLFDGVSVGSGNISAGSLSNGEYDITLTTSFDSIVFSAANKSTSYKVQSVSVESNLELAYNVRATDGDGDSVLAGFKVTLDADGNIHGTSANETIVGSSSADQIDGGGGEDVIHGGAGNDVIHGGTGTDSLFGDQGSDTFDAAESSEIHDFTPTGSDMDHLVGPHTP